MLWFLLFLSELSRAGSRENSGAHVPKLYPLVHLILGEAFEMWLQQLHATALPVRWFWRDSVSFLDVSGAWEIQVLTSDVGSYTKALETQEPWEGPVLCGTLEEGLLQNLSHTWAFSRVPNFPALLHANHPGNWLCGWTALKDTLKTNMTQVKTWIMNSLGLTLVSSNWALYSWWGFLGWCASALPNMCSFHSNNSETDLLPANLTSYLIWGQSLWRKTGL